MPSATKTAVFQLHAPSTRKRAALRDAMKRTHLATEAVLQTLLATFETIRAIPGKFDRTEAMQHVAYAVLRNWTLGSASAAAARVDAIGMVEGYLQQLGDGREKASPPRVLPIDGRPDRYGAALLDLADTHASMQREAELRDELNRMARPGAPRPLSLHGYGHFYRLLRHPEGDRLYAWINLLPRSSRFAATQAEANRRARDDVAGDMRDVATGETVRCKRPTWMLFPLEFGLDFQERRFLLAGQPGGGRIVYRPESDRFELHAAFTYAVQEIDTGQHFLGVDLGIYTLAAWAVVTADGAVVAEGAISGLELRFVQRRLEQQIRREQQRRGHVSIRTRRAQADEAVHRAANAIVAAAKQHRARVVLEELTPLRRRTKALPHGNRGGRAGRARRRILGRQQYAKLVQVLGYKLALAGLPRPVTVGAAYTSETCPECGHVAAENRPKLREPGQDRISMDAFRCVRCDHAADADRNAARVIGIKGAWLVQVPTRAERGGRTLREEERFAQYLLDAARRRGSSAGRPAVPS